MPNTRSRDLGDLERAVMTVLWDHGPDQSVREVMGALNEGRSLAYTTVMTVLDRLAKKDLARRRRDGRAFRYTAAASREELTAASMRSGLDTLDTGDRRAAMLHFLAQSDAGELADLRDALTEVERRHR
ncbi:MAG TPA: BlaI/MecI/CopY family transcriptional regulator [Ornithinimicrobium sp.]|uniref:BlaI/MecI/CopY family transcriptional regulator n=1 Tax=Ornithinimicrobium sp. TaxID=1977084 RepID=UPI002B48FE98|nr:BlaI/MecI/CopY family transcriptional regulator [Ornithinimicrobium sp.]HKJ11482.1 BlaI/MecI/CopY family transcriptional regulator [Ornithinimicrobium sp.]